MRMAYAGLSEWTIQMFGRWGSATVLRYVREALLGRQGGTIAQATEGLLPKNASLAEVRSFVKSILEGEHCAVGKEDCEVIEGTVLAQLEKQLLPDITKQIVELNVQKATEVIYAKIATLEKLLYHKKTSNELMYAKMGTRRRHLWLGGSKCFCGKPWRVEEHSSSARVACPETLAKKRLSKKASRDWCKECLAALACQPLVSGED